MVAALIFTIGLAGVAAALVLLERLPWSPTGISVGSSSRSVDATQNAGSSEQVEVGHAKVGSWDSERPVPVRLAIPAIHVSAPVVPLGLNADRTLEVPKNLADVGWFTDGPEPGEQGAAVVVGHVASRSGRGVFYRLGALRAGDLIKIRLRGGTIVRFRASSAIVVPKSRFPTRRVYAQTPRPTLRLITCSGAMDPSTGRHPDNRIVFASLGRLASGRLTRPASTEPS